MEDIPLPKAAAARRINAFQDSQQGPYEWRANKIIPYPKLLKGS